MDRSYDIPGRNTKNDEEKDINMSSWFKYGMSTLGVFLLALFKRVHSTSTYNIVQQLC
jgi:hypothetical protein